MKRLIQEISGAVAREHAAGSIGSVRRGSQAYDQDAGMRVAETGYGFAPVLLVAIGSTFGLRNLLAILYQPRTEPAGLDFLLEDFELTDAVMLPRRG